MCHYVHLRVYCRKALRLSDELHARCFCFNPCMICVISGSPEDFKSQLHKDRFGKHLIFISHWNEIDKSVPFVEIPFSTKPYKCMYVCQIQCTCCFSCILILLVCELLENDLSSGCVPSLLKQEGCFFCVCACFPPCGNHLSDMRKPSWLILNSNQNGFSDFSLQQVFASGQSWCWILYIPLTVFWDLQVVCPHLCHL